MTQADRKFYFPISLLSLLFFVLCFSIAQADQNAKSTAEHYYQSGMEAFENGDFEEAAHSLQESFLIFKRSASAYMASVVCLRIEDPWCAEEYANLALQTPPSLPEPLASDAVKIIEWAKIATKDYYYIARRAASFDPGAPSAPKEPPPTVAIPE